LLWTIFTVFMLLWMLELALQFGANVMPLLLVVGTIFLAVKQVFRRTSLS